jgi:hypothetical protein
MHALCAMQCDLSLISISSLRNQFDKMDKWKALAFFGIILLVISPFSFFERKVTLVVLQSTRIAKGLILNKPVCPNGHRQKAECKVKIIDNDSIKSIYIPSSICESIESGDTIILKHSKDFKTYYVDNYKYYKQEKQEHLLSIVCFISGLIILFYCFFKIKKTKA